MCLRIPFYIHFFKKSRNHCTLVRVILDTDEFKRIKKIEQKRKTAWTRYKMCVMIQTLKGVGHLYYRIVK
jgi:hypothetical protein